MTPRILLLLLCCLVLSACARLHGPKQFHRNASQYGLVRQLVSVGEFDLALYRPHPQPAGQRLHVYLEGDGLPWLKKVIINPEPTPGHPLMLRLMQQDSAPRLYLGRPCYLGTKNIEGSPCDNNHWWTFDRHHPRIVEAMATALARQIERHGYRQVSLLGHSGGGAMAMLMAPLVPEVDTVITIGANLDTDGWTQHHGYTPLYGSLNPAKQAPLDMGVRQMHLLGGKDQVVPPSVVLPWLREQSVPYRVYEAFNHHCCWGEVWPYWIRASARQRPWPPSQTGTY